MSRNNKLEKWNSNLKREINAPWQAEKSLRDKQIRMQMALDSAGIGIYEWNILTNELTWDDRVYDFWGLPHGTSVTLDTFMRAIHRDDVAATQAAMEKALDPDSGGQYYAEFRIISPGLLMLMGK